MAWSSGLYLEIRRGPYEHDLDIEQKSFSSQKMIHVEHDHIALNILDSANYLFRRSWDLQFESDTGLHMEACRKRSFRHFHASVGINLSVGILRRNNNAESFTLMSSFESAFNSSYHRFAGAFMD